MILITALLLLLAALSLSGCRKSSVIEQIIYDQNAKEIDYDNPDFVYNDAPEEDIQEEDLPSQDIEDFGSQDEPEPIPTIPGTTPSQIVVPAQTPTPARTNPSYPSYPRYRPTTGSDRNKPGKNDSGTSGDSAGATPDPNTRPFTDGRGKKVKLPEHVRATVVVGKAAPLVQMLGGKGILAGTSKGFLNDELAKSAFKKEGITSAAALWSEDGATMTEKNFNALLAMRPDVCVGVSGDSDFTSKQIEKLKEAKIAYVQLPRFSSPENIVKAVEMVGEMIGNNSSTGGQNASKLAKEYKAFCDEMLKQAAPVDEVGRNTLYISSWDADATFTMKYGSDILVQEKGLAVTPRGDSNSPINRYMVAAGVTNNGSRFVNTERDYYAAIPLNLDVAGNSIQGGNLKIYPNRAENFTRIPPGNTEDICLGEGSFSSIVVNSAATKERIQASPRLWKFHGKTTVGDRTDWGFVGDNGALVVSYIRGPYDIFVNPGGIGSWVDGSPESILEAPWVSWRLNNKLTEADVRNDIKRFYKKFYRYTLSESQLNKILNGKQK